MKLKTITGIATFLFMSTYLTGCGTIIQGPTQQVGISSSPTNATVSVNGELKGNTPLQTYLKRKDSHMVRIQLDGYEPFETNFIRGTSGWVWGNIVFGGLVGLAIDAMAGGMYKLSPEQINAEMRGAGAFRADREGDDIFITVVLEPKESWEKVGSLTPLK